MKNSELIEKLKALKENAKATHANDEHTYNRMQQIAGILSENDDRMAKYEAAKQNPKSLIGHEFFDLEQGMTQSGRGTITEKYKVISYLGEQGGTHYYKCQRLDDSGNPVEFARPKSYTLENILSIY